MKIKPIVMERFSTTHSSYELDFKFPSNITLIIGDSGTGKTASYSFIRECMSMRNDILCLDYTDYQKDILSILKTQRGKLIVIDNADILLTGDIRKYISTDDKNQYLIIGRNPDNLFTTKDNLVELESTVDGEKTIFTLATI